MFVDSVRVELKAGDGGPGVVSFRHEKYVEKGGPDGGDGGKGGDVIFVARNNQHTLAAFRYKKVLQAEDGKSGGKRKKRGRSAPDLVVEVPVGTMVIDTSSNDIIADLVESDAPVVIAKGGGGGFGNAHFKSSTRQAPRVAEKGEPGQSKIVSLELKMIADVGLVGLPNAGKSSLLSVLSNAKPEIGAYPFTTIRPYLGVVDAGDQNTFLCADIPGLIEGASKGKGLGDDFLRHVERTAVLLHLVDSYSQDVVEDYRTIQNELSAYEVDLTQKPQIVVLTKIESIDAIKRDEIVEQIKAVVPTHTPVLPVSSRSKEGIVELLQKTVEVIQLQRKAEQKQRDTEQAHMTNHDLPVISLPQTDSGWNIEEHDNTFIIHGEKIERFAHKTDFSNPHSVDRLRDIIRKMGIAHELVRRGLEPNTLIKIHGISHTIKL